MSFRLFFVLVLATACLDGGSTGVSDEFKETPFRFLPGVDLGMTGKELHRLRPAATYAPYLGLQEKIPGFTVSYQFPASNMESSAKDVGPNDRLQGVFIAEPFETMQGAELAWREQVSTVSSRHRAPTGCESFPTGGMQALWISGTHVLAIGVFPREPMAPTVPNRVIYAVSPSATLKQPPGATRIDCPKS
jgi:hypothetical protein